MSRIETLIENQKRDKKALIVVIIIETAILGWFIGTSYVLKQDYNRLINQVLETNYIPDYLKEEMVPHSEYVEYINNNVGE